MSFLYPNLSILHARLQCIQFRAGIPTDAWDLVYLEYLENMTFDIWPLIVYAAILLRRYAAINNHNGHSAPLDPWDALWTTPSAELGRRCNTALTLAAKVLHDGPVFLKTAFDTERDFCDSIHWKIWVNAEEFMTEWNAWTITKADFIT